VGQSRQGGGGVQSGQSGSASVPETIGEWRPQAEQAADRRWQAQHHGSPVARETPQCVVVPQMEQSMVGSDLHVPHSGPCGPRVWTRR
jgi:hypothetical protein